MPTRLEKVHAHASHLLDAFIQLRERYAMLEPMLFNEQVVRERGSRKQARGFKVLTNSLFLSCAQDIAKLVFDDDERTPSIRNITKALEDYDLRMSLAEAFSVCTISVGEDENDPEVHAALREMEMREKADSRHQFDVHYIEMQGLWVELSSSSTVNAFRVIRDKITAHTEVRFEGDKYRLVEISTLGIKWGDLRKTIQQMQRLVELTGLLVRKAGFAWESLDDQLSKASEAFWALPTDAS